MKRILILILSLVLLILCEIIPQESSAQSKMRIGISYISTNSIYRKKEIDLFLKLGSRANYEVIVKDADGDEETQKHQLDALISEKVKSIVLYASVDGSDYSEVLLRAKEEGIKIIRYDSLNGYTPADVGITVDYSEIGKLQGKWILSKCNNGKIAIFSGSSHDPVAKLLYDGAMSEISEKVLSGNYKIIFDKSVDNWDPQNAITLVEQNPIIHDADIIIAANDLIANAVSSKIVGKPICGMDADLENCRLILQGKQDMTILKDWNDRVKTVITLWDKIRNNTFDNYIASVKNSIHYEYKSLPVIYVPSVVITKTNIQELIKRNWYTKDELNINEK